MVLQVDPAVVRAYGELTNDNNPIHTDPVFAANTPMGACIAHGTMSICLMWQSLFRTFTGLQPDQVELDVRFVKPVVVGETIQAGGRQQEGRSDCFDIWVRGADAADRVVGTVRVQLDREAP
ncbi:MAG TPA: MaoC family dehydratase [Rhodocyclaceae bacterium]|nr:MaoC family dehydratase [Rhodocyclaceae bacterium]